MSIGEFPNFDFFKKMPKKRKKYNLNNEKALLDKLTRSLAKDIAKKNGEPYLDVLERMIHTAKELGHSPSNNLPAKTTNRSTLKPKRGPQNFG